MTENLFFDRVGEASADMRFLIMFKVLLTLTFDVTVVGASFLQVWVISTVVSYGGTVRVGIFRC